jgi:ADP-ribose pyrophosphatase YjhB (NUDIX family)
MRTLLWLVRAALNLTPTGALLMLFTEVLEALLPAVKGWLKKVRLDSAPAAARAQLDSCAFQARLASLVLCQHDKTGKLLALREPGGWAVPALTIEVGQTLSGATVANVQEQAGVCVELVGILTMELTRGEADGISLRTVFFARATADAVKRCAVGGRGGGAWLSIDELEALENEPPPNGLCGRELLEWGRYLKEGGTVFPLELLQGPADAPSEGLRRAAMAARQGCNRLAI